MIIVDECHHVPAVTFEQILETARAKYIYGLTATPKRQDGHHPILYYMYLDPIRYQVDAKHQAGKRPFAHSLIPRFTGTRFHLDKDGKSPAIVQYYGQIIQDDCATIRLSRMHFDVQRKKLPTAQRTYTARETSGGTA